MQEYMRKVNTSNILNGSAQDLKNFIQEREWGGDQLWGGHRDDFLREVGSLEEKEHLRKLRLYIQFNMAYQTRIILQPFDGLHRVLLCRG